MVITCLYGSQHWLVHSITKKLGHKQFQLNRISFLVSQSPRSISSRSVFSSVASLFTRTLFHSPISSFKKLASSLLTLASVLKKCRDLYSGLRRIQPKCIDTSMEILIKIAETTNQNIRCEASERTCKIPVTEANISLLRRIDHILLIVTCKCQHFHALNLPIISSPMFIFMVLIDVGKVLH